MEFWTAVAVLRRRWYVFVPILVVTVLAGGFLAGQVKPTYKASGSVYLARPANDPATSGATPTTTVEGVGGANPISELEIFQALNIVSQIANDLSFRDEVVAAGGDGNYEVLPPFSSTPSLQLSTFASTPERALSDYTILVDSLNKELLKQQEGSPPVTILTAHTVTSPHKAYPQNGSRTKVLIVVAIVGFLTAILMSFLVDSVAAARARRRRRSAEEKDGELVSLIPTRTSDLDELADLGDIDGPSARSMRW